MQDGGIFSVFRDLLRILDPCELITLEKALCNQEEPKLGTGVALIADYRAHPKSTEGEEEDELITDVPVTVGSPSSVDDELIEARDAGSSRQSDSISRDSSLMSVADAAGDKPEELSVSLKRKKEGDSECSVSSESSVSEEEASEDPLTTVRIGMDSTDGREKEPDVEITSWQLNKFCQSSSKGSGGNAGQTTSGQLMNGDMSESERME